MKTRLNCFWNCCLYFALQNCVGKGSGVTPKTHISVRSWDMSIVLFFFFFVTATSFVTSLTCIQNDCLLALAGYMQYLDTGAREIAGVCSTMTKVNWLFYCKRIWRIFCALCLCEVTCWKTWVCGSSSGEFMPGSISSYFATPPITYCWTAVPPNLGPLISRWEIDKFENCWYKSVRILEVLKLLFPQFLNLSSSQRDMSGPKLGDVSNNRSSRVLNSANQRQQLYVQNSNFFLANKPGLFMHLCFHLPLFGIQKLCWKNDGLFAFGR